MRRRAAWAGSKIKGLGTGERRASTAWIRYNFIKAQQTVNIQIYRYSWVMWERLVPVAKFDKTREDALQWCRDWKFQYIREPVLHQMSGRYTLKHQDGTTIDE